MENEFSQKINLSKDSYKEDEAPLTKSGMNRRKFVEMAATSALAFTIVPRHVLGGKNYTAPSDKITMA